MPQAEGEFDDGGLFHLMRIKVVRLSLW